MKQTISYFLLPFLVILTFNPLVAFAQSPDAGPVKSVLENVLTFLKVVIPILITLALLVFGWGIIKLITAGEDVKKRTDAKGILTWGIIGIFVLTSMYGIITFVKDYIGIPENQPIQVPKFQ